MMLARIYLMTACFILLAFAMGARVVYLHVVERDFLQDQGDARTIRMERINAHRGMIQDRHGRPLAVSSPVVSIWANPAEVAEGGDDIKPLALMLGTDEEAFREKIASNMDRKFVYLRRHMVPERARRVLDLDIKGIYEEKEYHRFYPAGEVTAHLVGFTNIDDEGQEGLELSYNEWLKGSPGKKKVLKNVLGDVIKDVKPIREAKPGNKLTLSLDLRVQYLAYRELKSAIRYYNAHSGSVVLLDVDTGEILAMVNQPSYNPNNRQNLRLSAVRNRAVTDEFEPGSTVKPFTVAVALASGKYAIDSTIDTSPGFMRVDDKTIRDPSNRGVLDLGGIIAKSSQVGISRLALSLNEFDIREMYHRVGLGESTGIGFPGESNGYLPNHRRWTDIERVTFAYGYGLTVTPLQLASAYLTIASGGTHKRVSALLGSEPRDVRVMDGKVAEALRHMLQRVVTEGTGTRAALDEYSIAGKTGTVRKMGESGYEDTHHIAFFAGMAPVEKPKVVGVVLINDPDSERYGGGAIAAPVFSRIMAGVLRLLNVPPKDILEAV
ncbi:MAG: penicillin-binding protein 2 [Pseudomonadales bacterium]|nr:penicillin-binding protein 2 [Pseudomonadales bacterium]